MEKMSKKITVQLDINTLSDERIKKLKDLTKHHKGNKNLNILVYDIEEKIKITMPSRNSKVEISKELLDELTYEDMHFKLN